MTHLKITLLLVVGYVFAIHAGIRTIGDEISDHEKFFATLQYHCRQRTGNDETFNRIKSYTEIASNCVASRTNLENAEPSLTSSNRVEFFSRRCSLLRDVWNCSNLALSEMRKCLSQELSELVDAWDSATEEALSFACKNGGEIFFDSDGQLLECVENPNQLLVDCPKTKSHLEPVDKQCRDLLEWRNCFQSKLIQCNAPRLIELLDITFRAVVTDPCRKYSYLMSLDWNTTSIVEGN